MNQPANRRWIAGTGLGQCGKPRSGILARGDHLDGHQAGKRDQRDEAHQVTQQRAVGVNRVANHTAGPGQRCAEFTVDDAQQQHRKTAQQPGKDPRRPRDGGHVTGCEQPAGTEDGPQSDKRKVYQRKLFFELALA
ncbi:hypothetical protein D3C73_731540 [compost metagenome]